MSKLSKAIALSDLDVFEQKFDCKLIKRLPAGLEVRVAQLERGRFDAQKFIDHHKLNLEISTEGSMVMLKAFLVKERSAA